jgi:mannose-6-phosphate isomerase-like protein (cupin superfamily)
MTLLADPGKAAPAQPSPGLSYLVDPVEVDVFRREYWERKPLLVQRDDLGYYAGLLSLADVDSLMSTSGLLLDNLRVVLNGREMPVSQLKAAAGVNSLEAAYAYYRNGYTLVLNRLDGRFEPLQRLSRRLAAEVNARFQVNVYVTPARNQGFAPHYDTHDVFVAQVHGSKKWRVASQPYELPLGDRTYDKSQPKPEPELEFELRAGDMLYLPRGAVHWAESNDTVSVHVTVGVHPLLWSDLIGAAVREAFAADARFRKGLPIGFVNDPGLRTAVSATADELFDALRGRLSADAIADTAVERGVSVCWPTLTGHLLDLEEVDRINLNRLLRRRPDQMWSLAVRDDLARLMFHDKTVEFPAAVADEVRHVAERGEASFTAKDIPGELDESGRLVLVKTLVREGFLTVG